VLGEHEFALKVKGTDLVTNEHLKGIRALKEGYARSYNEESMGDNPRRTEDGI
jgi:hypothetical protein